MVDDLRDDLFLAELNERLFVHFLGQHWRAPLSQRAFDVWRPRPGRIICADQRDIARALASVRGGAFDPRAVQAAAQAAWPRLRAVRRLEGVTESEVEDPDCDALPVCDLPGADGPVGLLTGAQVSPLAVARVFMACAARGVLWKPSPRAAASAHLLMRHLGPVAGDGLALVQGDHATGCALAGAAPTLFVSDQPVPDGLPVTVMRAPTGPRRP